jgi:hypothetical protein
MLDLIDITQPHNLDKWQARASTNSTRCALILLLLG